MRRKIFYVIAGALLFLALIVLLWFWFFGKSAELKPTGDGSLGTAQTKPGGITAGTGGNNQTLIGTTPNAQIPTQYSDTSFDVGGGVFYSTTGTDYISFDPYSGAIWLDGGSLGGNQKTFTPTPINSLKNANISGLPFLNSGSGSGGGGGLGLGDALLGVGITGAVTCTAGYLAGVPSGAGSTLSHTLRAQCRCTTPRKT